MNEFKDWDWEESEEFVEPVETCKFVYEYNEINGHDCWGNIEITTHKCVFINGNRHICWDGWYVRHDGKDVLEILPSSLLLYKL